MKPDKIFGMRRWLVLAAMALPALYACPGYLGVDPPDDAGADAPDVADGGGGEGGRTGCDPTKPFGTPEPIFGINTGADEASAWATQDELTLYVIRGTAGQSSTFDIFRATRDDISKPFGPLSYAADLSSSENDDAPTLTADGLTAVFSSRRPNGADSNIYLAKRTSPTGAFEAGTIIPVIDDPADNVDPFVIGSTEVRAIYFGSARGDGGLNIWVARAAQGFIASPTPVPNVNGPTIDSQPVLTSDELVMFLSSDRPGTQDQDVFVTTRQSLNVEFGTPVPVPELNSPAVDVPTWISDDRCVIYISSTRFGTRDVFRAVRPP